MSAGKASVAVYLVNDIADEVRDAFLAMDKPVKQACSVAVFIAGQNTIRRGQANISAGIRGGGKFQKSWTARYYPGGKKGQQPDPSIDAAVFCYSKIPFLEIFEDGGTIHGKPMLWIPLRNAPLTVGHGISRGHLTPGKLRAQGIKLFSISRAGKPPLLATKVNVARAQARRSVTNITLARLKNSIKRKPGVRQVRVAVPLFFGIEAVKIKKKFDLAGIAQSERDSLANYYLANLKVD